MADISAQRERQIDEMLDLLTSKDPEDRREAALWFGEAAVADAVPDLVDLYEKDENPRVREAAAYALGMFRAVDQAIKNGKEKRVVKLLEQVEQQGKLGSRANKGGWIRLVLGLLIALGVLGAAYVLLPNEIIETAQTALARVGVLQVTPSAERDALARQVRQYYTFLRDDTSTLQTQFQSALGGGAFDCAAYFNNPQPMALSSTDAVAYPDLAAIVRRLNAARESYAGAYARYDESCLRLQPLPPEELGSTYAILVSAIQALPEIETALVTAEQGEAPPPTATVGPTPEPTSSVPTEVPPTPTDPPPTTEITIADPRSHLSSLYGVLDGVTGQRGALTLLEQYWGDIQRTGVLSACSATIPSVPDNYTLPQADALASEALARAVELINQGLELTRTGWTDLTFACNSGTAFQRANDELTEARTARAAFMAAEQALNIVRDEI